MVSPVPDGTEVGVEGQHEVAEGVARVAAAHDGLLQQHHLHRLQPVLEQLRPQRMAAQQTVNRQEAATTSTGNSADIKHHLRHTVTQRTWNDSAHHHGAEQVVHDGRRYQEAARP